MNFPSDLAFRCLNASPCGYMVLNSDQRICFWNIWLEQSSGKSSLDVCGKLLTDIFPSLHGSRLQDSAKLALEDGLASIITPKLNRHPLPLFNRVATGEKKVFPQVLRVQSVKDSAAVHFCLIQVEDVSGAFHREHHLRQQATDLQQQKQALTESEARFRSLFAAAPVGLLIVSVEELTIHLHNKQASHLLQMEGSTNIGSLSDLLPRKKDRQALRDYAATKAEEPGIFTVKIESQHHPWGLLSLSPCSFNGEPALIGGLLDISRRVEAEQIATTACLDAEQANAAKSMFLAHMSHEIRTPLNAIIGLSQLTLAETPVGLVHDNLEKIEQSGQLLLSLINDILDFSKIEAGEMQLDLNNCDLDELTGQIIDTFNQQTTNKGLDFTVTVNTQVPRFVETDSLRLQQILNNLMSNAVKFTSSGQINLRIDWLKSSSCNYLNFEIEDSGIGMDSQTVKKLFRPFAQADSSTSRCYGGTGLGLVISQRLSKILGGEIQVSSQSGVGSCFRLCLPITTASSPMITVPKKLLGQTIAGWQLSEQQKTLVKRALSPWQFSYQHLTEHSQLKQFSIILSNDPNLVTSEVGKVVLPPHTLSASQLRTAIINSLYTESDAQTPLSDTDKILSEISLLVVEDNAINQQVVRAILENFGCTVVIASSGTEALEMLGNHDLRTNIDAVLMDIQMPGMDGYETTKLLRAHPFDYKKPIIALTAHAMNEDRSRCLDVGMDDHVGKPIQAQQLLRVLQQHVCLQNSDITTTITTPQQVENWQPTQGLARVGDDKTLFFSLISQFQQNYTESSLDLKTLSSWSLKQQKFWLHNLKGVAANLGAMPLSRCAANLELELDQDSAGNIAQSLWIQLQQALVAALHTMLEWQAENERSNDKKQEDGPSDQATPEKTRALLKIMLEQLQLQDLEALDNWQELKKLLQPNCRELIDQLSGELTGLEFAAAQNTLQQISSLNNFES